MSRVRRVLGSCAALIVVAACAVPAAAMELVVFESDRSLVVEAYVEEADQVTLTLPGGGVMGIPKRMVKVHYPGWVPPLDLSRPGERLPKGLPYRDLIARYCQENQMDWKLVAALIRVESNFNPNAVSPKGAEGLMQLMPSTQKEEGVSNPFVPEENIRAGVRYLKKLLDVFQGDLSLTLAAYNAGVGRVQKYQAVPPIPETQAYVTKILALYPTL